MGFVKDAAGFLEGANNSIMDIADPGYVFHAKRKKKTDPYQIDKNAFLNPESQSQQDLASIYQEQAAEQSNLSQQQQLEQRAKQLDFMQSLGLMSKEQADIEKAPLLEQTNIAGQQASNVSALIDQAEGRGPSLAIDALTNATDRNIKQIKGNIASQRGVNPALALRVGTQQMGEVNQQAASDAATLRLQEQMAAREQLLNALNSSRQQSQTQGSTASTNRLSALSSGGDIANTIRAGDLQSKQLSDTNRYNNQSLAADLAEKNRLAAIDEQKLRLGQNTDLRTQEFQKQQADQARRDNMLQKAAEGVAAFYTGGASLAATQGAKAAAGNAKKTDENPPAILA